MKEKPKHNPTRHPHPFVGLRAGSNPLPIKGEGISHRPAGVADGNPLPQTGCCRIESVVTVDERGQMVLPKEVRRKAGIQPGDRLAVITPEQDGRTCCILLVKVDAFAARARELLGPLLGDILK